MPPTEQDIAKLEQRLASAHGQADSLLEKLHAIKAVVDQLPAIEFLDELETRLDSIREKCLAIQSPMTTMGPSTDEGIGPTAGDLNLLAAKLGEVVVGLQQFSTVAERLAAEVGMDTEAS